MDTTIDPTKWILRHDLSLMFDPGGRLWRFRPAASAHGRQPVQAEMAGTDLVLTVAVPEVQPGDIDVHVRGDVLEIRGITPATSQLACDVGLPLRVDTHTIETVYDEGVFEVRLPTRKAVETPSVEPAPARRLAMAGRR